MVTFEDVITAHKAIKPMINQTPVLTSATLNTKTGARCFIKCENFQKVGAFKFRGVSNRLNRLSEEEKSRGVITHSSGNHAQAVALASRILGIKAVIVMPKNAPRVKVEATRDYGAEIVRSENSVESRAETCKRLQKKYGYILVHPYDDDLIIAGAGTAALELFEFSGKLDYIFCPLGGGGLLSGTGVASKGLNPGCFVIGVEPCRADDAFRSLRNGIIYPSIYPDTIADGLRTALSERTFDLIKKNVDEIITVSEEEIVDAMKFLWVRMKIVVEPSGAVSVAGLIKYAKHLTDLNAGAIISGGNLDLDDFFTRLYKEIT